MRHTTCTYIKMNIHPKDEIILTRVNLHTFFLGVVQCMFNRRSPGDLLFFPFLFSFLNRIFNVWELWEQNFFSTPPSSFPTTTSLRTQRRWKNFEQNLFSTPPPSSFTTSLRTQCRWKNEKVLPPTLGVGTTTRPQRCHQPLPGSPITNARSCTKMD